MGSQGGDYYHGGIGFDILNYSGSSQAVNVSFYLNAGYGARDSRGDRFADDTLEGLRGSSKGDILVGDDGRSEMFFGGGGADAIRGNGGNDIIYGEGLSRLAEPSYNLAKKEFVRFFQLFYIPARKPL